RNSAAQPLLVQHAAPDQRPYIHPILAPDGQSVLTENAPAHHPWQHGLYVGLNAVNGVGFWTEGLKGPRNDGTFHPHPVEEPLVRGTQVQWSVRTDWRAPNGTALLLEEQQWTFIDHADSYDLQLDWQLTARVDLTFGQSAYGGLFLRMPYRAEAGGEVVNSEGQTNDEAEAQRARWVAVSMPLAGRTPEMEQPWAGIAILEHPNNRKFPTPWRIDNQLGIGPSPCIAGAWQLAAGAIAQTRYGLFVFCGRIQPAAVEARWTLFSR
ncbi:MAG: PmoA family protein, partial [Chloroflexota bacterium]|nr:PmoA family protein [Chloroflexota bacterium]